MPTEETVSVHLTEAELYYLLKFLEQHGTLHADDLLQRGALIEKLRKMKEHFPHA